jgi:hypothetical protein
MNKIQLGTILFFIGVIPSYPQILSANPGLEQSKSGLCDLMKNSDLYSGKTVKITTTLRTGPESFYFYDNSCKASIVEPDVIADVTYVEGYDFSTKLQKNLNRL